MRRLALACALLAWWACWAAGAQAEERYALVVGVGAYAALPALPNAVADARAIAKVLSDQGFVVTPLFNPTGAALRRAVAQAGDRARSGSAVLFHFAGHAVQLDGRNYLFGADAAPLTPDEVEDQGLDLGNVAGRLAEAPARIILLDACRDNPVAFMARAARETRFTPLTAGVGTTIVFATAPGQPAQDGGDGHSPFARALLTHLPKPGLDLHEVLRLTANDTQRLSGGRQKVQIMSGSGEQFFIAPLAAASPNPARWSGQLGTLLTRLQPASGTKRLHLLDDALREAPLQRGLDAGQALAILGDIPAPALRRRALAMVIPALLAPLGEPDASRLLASFDGAGRATTIELLLPCLALPMDAAQTERILGDIPFPQRAALTKALHVQTPPGTCPSSRS